MGGGQRQVDVARLADRLAAVERLEHGEFPGPFLKDARNPEEVLGALARRQIGPAVLEGVAGGADREVDVLGASVGDLR